MRVSIILLALLPLFASAAKELPGEELPSKDYLSSPSTGNEDADGQGGLVKRSITDIAARRRSALDKTFMRFGRSDPNFPSENRVKLSGGNLMRFGRSRQDSFLRLGRSKNQDFMRFGRASGNLMRFGRASGNLMRFGRANNNLMRFGRAGNNMMRFGRANNNLMRFGRANNNLMRFGRANNNLMRFGRANNNLMRFGRANSNLMRFGRSDDDSLNYDPIDDGTMELNDEDKRASNSFLRLERSVKEAPEPTSYADRKNDNFMRLGRSLADKTEENEEDQVDNVQENGVDDDGGLINDGLYYNGKFLRMLGKDTGDSSDDAQPGDDAFDGLFSEDSRRKRSLTTTTAADITKTDNNHVDDTNSNTNESGSKDSQHPTSNYS